MSEQQPRKGDTVLVNFKAGWVTEQDGQRIVDVADGLGPIHIQIPAWATVEVSERADDPSKDLTGSIRRTKAVTCIARERDGGPDFHRWIAVELNEAFTDEHMRGSEVIGAVPGTPAAESEKPDDDLAQTPGPRCNAIEGATGINCRLPRLHGVDVDHEGSHEPAGEKDSVGYRLFVRWPWNEWDRDAAKVGFEMPLPDWEREILEQEAARQPEAPPAEARKLIVHPHAWKSLESYLASVRIRVVRLNRFDGDQTPVYAMVPMDGEWGSDAD